MERGEEDRGARALRAMSYVLLGGAVALLLCFVFLFICSLLISRGILKESMMPQLTVIACVVGSFAGGAVSVSKCRARTLIVGLSVGAVLFLLLLTIGVLFYESMSLENSALALLCGCLCGGALAGLFGSKPKKKRRK